MAKHSTRVWDKSDRECVVCGDLYSPIRHSQRYCSPPKRCRYSNKARILSRNPNPKPLWCADCGAEFMPRASNQYTCGMKCPGKPLRYKKCAYAFCGKKFVLEAAGDRQIYCSLSCNRKEDVFRKYKMSSKDYVTMLDEQKGICAACGNPPHNGERLHVDHDHRCCDGHNTCGRCVTALIHRECNITEGLFRDDPARLIGVADYILRKYS